jgi:hypothetical protein
MRHKFLHSETGSKVYRDSYGRQCSVKETTDENGERVVTEKVYDISGKPYIRTTYNDGRIG